MARKQRLRLGTLCVALAVLCTGCALHTPERASLRFVHDIRNGVAKSEGSSAFDRLRMDLHLTEHPPRQVSARVYRKSANWSRGNKIIGLVSSNVLQDPPDRFDLRLVWSPPRPLRTGLLERTLGPPDGKSATGDNGWVIEGGVLEYRSDQTETPYLLFSSPAYIRDPLDFLEAANLPHLPSLESVSRYLERNTSEPSLRRTEEGGFESRTFHPANGVSIAVYSGIRPHGAAYLAGLTISIAGGQGTPVNAAGFLPILRDLEVPTPEQLLAAAIGARVPSASTVVDPRTDSFAVYQNFALALTQPPKGDAPGTSLTLWRRIESPRSLCEHLRPDLERCSSRPH